MQRRPTALHLLNNKKYIWNPNTVSQSFLRECIYVSTWEQTHDAVSPFILVYVRYYYPNFISVYLCPSVSTQVGMYGIDLGFYVYMFAFNRILIGCSRCCSSRYYVTFWCSSFFEYLVKDLVFNMFYVYLIFYVY